MKRTRTKNKTVRKYLNDNLFAIVPLGEWLLFQFPVTVAHWKECFETFYLNIPVYEC